MLGQKFFISRYNNKCRNKICERMEIDGTETSNLMEMSMHLREVYEKIFNNKNNYKIGNIEKFLQERLVLTDLPKFSKTVADSMDEQILGEEVDCAVEKLKGGTAPGYDLATPELIIFIHGIVPSLIKDFVIEFLEGNKEDR